MVNITNNQIKLLKNLLDEYFDHKYSTENYFKYQDLYIDLKGNMDDKKNKNKQQYEDRKFWKEFDKGQGIKIET